MSVKITAAVGLLALVVGTAACGDGAEMPAKTVESTRQGEKAPQAGEKAPALTLQQLFQAPEGTAANWDALKGKTVVLEFWSTGCGPCIESIPRMNELAEAMKDKPVQFIAVTANDPKSIEHFIKKRRMAAWVGIDMDRTTFKAYGVNGIPCTVLVDANGTIAAVTHPSKLSAEIIERVIAGKDPGIEPPRERRCDIRKGACGEKGGDATVTVTLQKCEDEQKRPKIFSGPWFVEVSNMQPDRFIPHIYRLVYDIPSERIELKATLPKDVRYDVRAKAPSRENSALREPLKAAVEAEFALESRLETKETDVYVLTVDPEKKELLTAAEGSDEHGIAHVDSRQIVLINRTLDDLSVRLERFLKRPVVDETGLDGKFDLVAEWKGEGVDPMTEAMQDSLGLVLTPARRPVEILTVTNAKGKGDQ